MEKFTKSLFLVLLALCFSVSLTSCGGDDDDPKPDEPVGNTIIGQWGLSVTQTDTDGSIYSLRMDLTFNKDYTGSIVETWTSQSRAATSNTYAMNFNWSTTSDANGNDILKVSYVSGDHNTELFYGTSSTALWTRQYVLTGTILNIYGGDGVWVFNKK
ncbi:MAG: hypothetical protein NC339_02710 [Muribaculaceae bacterium]|nr:hypothetical protein [Muribaculaceae bacterium]